MPAIKEGRKSKSVEMDMAPMIDCVFLLLIFFMVATTFAPMPGLRVQLPPPGKPNPNKPKGLIIRVANPDPGQYQGTMMLNEDVVQLTEIKIKKITRYDLDKEREKLDSVNSLIEETKENIRNLCFFNDKFILNAFWYKFIIFYFF